MSAYSSLSPLSGLIRSKPRARQAFTLIELLMVIAIIGILASILLPVVNLVREKAKIAASKTQLSGYVNAIGMFKGEYNYYPFSEAHQDGGETIPSIGQDEFVGTLSGRKLDGTSLTSEEAKDFGNRRMQSFYDFPESDFKGGSSASGEIADRFNNTRIFIAIDGDGDGIIKGVPAPEGSGNIEIRAKVTAYVLDDTEDDLGVTPDYYLYD